AIKLGLPDVAHTGRVAGLIFALSTLGCLIGNYFTGFYLIPHFTINTLVLVSVGVLLALACATFLMLQNPSPTPPPTGEGQKIEDGTLTPPSLVGKGDGGLGSADTNPHAFPDIRQAYAIVFLASFCGMTLELTASRVLAQYLGVSLFTWTGIIGVMLAGTALGNFTGGQLADRPIRTLAWLAGVATWFLTVAIGLVVAYSLDFPVWHLLGIEPSPNSPNPLFRGPPEPAFVAKRQQLEIMLIAVAGIGVIAGYGVYRLLKRLPAQTSLSPRFFL